MKHKRFAEAARISAALACALICFAPLRAHHSTAEYDAATFVEAEGIVTQVLWQNPHVRLEISTERFDGVSQLWLLEGQSPGDLDRARIPRDLIAVGDRVRFAGNPSTRRERRMYVTNVLLADDTEIVLRANAQPRWQTQRYLSHLQATIDPERAAADRGDGIFRVWLPTAATTPEWASDPPLTPEARKAWQAFDAIRDDPVIDCTPPGMPQVITRSGRYAIRFERSRDDILLKNEYREIDRVIHMTPGAAPSPRTPTPLGHSTGRWEGATLVVTTTDIDWPYFQLYGLEGVPQSRDMTIVERFTPSADGRELIYDIEATDPRTFTRTVSASGYRTFRWQPGFQFLPQNCVLDAGGALEAQPYEPVADWLEMPAGRETLGPMHGDIAVSRAGDVYVSIETAGMGVQVFSADGRYLRSLANAPADLHGFVIRDAGDGEHIYGVSLRGQKFVKLTLAGDVVFEIPRDAIPREYWTPNRFSTELGVLLSGMDVAPNGDLYVTDGYSSDYIHRFDSRGRYLGTFGGKAAPYGFDILHKIAMDTRFDPVRIIATDRLNNRVVHLSLDGEFLGVVNDELLLPAALTIDGDHAIVGELNGRVTVLDKSGNVVTHVGTNTDEGIGTNRVPPEQWRTGRIIAAHGVATNGAGDLFVAEFSTFGRIHKFRRR